MTSRTARPSLGIKRVVVDTNVLISAALIAKGKPFEVLRTVLDSGVLVLSDQTFNEAAAKLSRAKFDRYVSIGLRERFLVQLAAVAEWTTITGTLHACRDPDDDAILETAIAGQADYLVTGDRDLLVLHAFRGVAILTPADYLATLR